VNDIVSPRVTPDAFVRELWAEVERVVSEYSTAPEAGAWAQRRRPKEAR
jgi:hypothetical protein